MGPCKISFRYKYQSYGGTFSLTCDSTYLINKTEYTNSDEGWNSAEFDLASGSHTLTFTYHHPGIGFAYMFNGVRIDEFTATGQSPVVSPTGGTTWYVNGSMGSDDNSGTSESSAKATIQAAIDASSVGDTILVAPGTYAPIATGNKSITIRSTSGFVDTIIDAAGTGTRCVLGAFEGFCYGRDDSDICTNSVIVGFTLRNGDWPMTYGGGDGGCVLGGTYKLCRLLNGTASGGGNAGQAVLENCLLGGGRAYNGGNACGCIIRNCTIVDGFAEHNGGAYYNCAVFNSICYNNDSGWRWGDDEGTSYQVGSWVPSLTV